MNQEIEGQLSIPMSLNASNYVVQANDLITAKQGMNLNEAKLLRLAIMQIIKEDKELKPYVVSIRELAGLLDISDSNLYRDVENICDNITKKPAKVRKGKSWKTIPWVSYIEYKDGTGKIYLQLNNELKPYLLNLQEYYTQYCLDNILAMKSVYAIRIFELLQKELIIRMIPKEGTHINLSVSMIREACECEDKYSQFGMFKKKVIDAAIKEIERVTLYTVSYEYIKKSRTVIGFNFLLNMKYH